MYRYFKRFLDFLFSFLFIIVLSPFFIITPLLIWLTMDWPAIYTQRRIGLNNREFRIYKFRSMRHKTEIYQTDDSRITAFGRFIRVTRIDEFPQLFNILKGDMSFIGPRPLLPEYLPYYTKEEVRRHDVRPGLSGLSQVHSSYPSWEEQFNKDISYVEHLSFMLDVRILVKTIKKVLLPSHKLVSGISGRVKFDQHRIMNKQTIK